MVKEVNKANFEKEVLNARKLVLIEIWGPKCGPCKALMPQVEKLAEKYSKKLRVLKINAEENIILCMRLKVMSLPTLILYKKGEEIKRLTGSVTVSILEKAIEEALA